MLVALFSLALLTSDAPEGPYLYEQLRRPAYRQTLVRLFPAKRKVVPWVRKYIVTRDGVDAPSRTVTLGEKTYEVYTICKPHECPGNVLTLLFEPGGRKAWACLTVDGDPAGFFGNPDPELQRELLALAR